MWFIRSIPLFCLLAAAPLLADGIILSKEQGRPLSEPAQTGILLFDGKQEQLIIKVDVHAVQGGLAWIVPLPARPEVAAASDRLFEEIGYLAPTPERHRAGRAGSFQGMAAASGEVVVHQRMLIGGYDLAVLSAFSGESILTWAQEHGYALDPALASVLEEYAARGCYFVVAQAASQAAVGIAAPPAGLQPLSFSFPSKQIYFPLKISSHGPAASEILLYVFAMYKVRTLKSSAFQVEYSSWIPDYRVEHSWYSSLHARHQAWLLTTNKPQLEAAQIQRLEKIEAPAKLQRGRYPEAAAPEREQPAAQLQKREAQELAEIDAWLARAQEAAPQHKAGLSTEAEARRLRVRAYYARTLEELDKAPPDEKELRRQWQAKLEQRKREALERILSVSGPPPPAPLSPEEDLAYQFLSRLKNEMYYVTKLRAKLTPQDMSADLVFERAENNTEVQ
jgi:hypothetical protein